jgi:hypothetical protein
MTPNINPYKMNIQNKFDLYIENKLSDSEKTEFERDLLEQPELAQSYNAYYHINHILENELYSPVLNYDNDPVLKELSISQRLAIEDDYIRFNSKGSDNPGENSLIADKEKHPDPGNSYPNVWDNRKTDSEPDEANFLKLLNKASEKKSPGKIKIYRLYIGIAAVIVLSFLAGKIIFGLNLSGMQKMSPQQAYTLFYHPGTDKELKSFNFNNARLKSAYFDNNRSDLNTADIFSNHEDYEMSLLFLGIIHLERKDYSEAGKCFTRILAYEHPVKVNSVNFYLSLTYLAEGYLAEAEPLLVKLSETKNPYRKKARVILRSIKAP